MIQLDQLEKIFPKIPKGNLPRLVSALNGAFILGDINTRDRIAMFLAQTGHESAQYRYSREVWNGSPQQLRYERDFLAAWPPTKLDIKNKLAFNLGNLQKNDGYNFRGWGPLQITGRGNTLKASTYLFKNNSLTVNFQLLDSLDVGMKGAVWYWASRNINRYCDTEDIEQVTKIINGGLNGFDERKHYYELAKKVL